jgi:hypothetical protein
VSIRDEDYLVVGGYQRPDNGSVVSNILHTTMPGAPFLWRLVLYNERCHVPRPGSLTPNAAGHGAPDQDPPDMEHTR